MTRASTTKPFGHRARLSARRPRLLLLCAAVSAERSHTLVFNQLQFAIGGLADNTSADRDFVVHMGSFLPS